MINNKVTIVNLNISRLNTTRLSRDCETNTRIILRAFISKSPIHDEPEMERSVEQTQRNVGTGTHAQSFKLRINSWKTSVQRIRS